jgi:LAS superfamily LD-carboxypeptidase LdcB
MEVSKSNNSESVTSTNLQKDSLPTYIDTNYVMGKFEPSTHPEFIEIAIKYADQVKLYMHKEAYDSFIKMWDLAKSEGITLTIRSAARNFNHQKGIWQRKWTGETLLEGQTNAQKTYQSNYERAIAIMRFSSMPGTSRHHWGTDIDLNAFNNSYFESGKGLKEYTWLKNNAEQFGFVQVYTNKALTGRSGYNEEKWHWSYKPISALCQKVAQETLENKNINGFEGSEVAEKIDVKENYIFGIDKSCY